jgi:hypothetical protein
MKLKWLMGLIVFAADAAYGGLAAPRSLLDLQQSADLIVVAAASGMTQSGLTTVISLNVNRVVKGNPALIGTQIFVNWSSPDSTMLASVAPTEKSSGIWFVQQAAKSWQLLPVIQGAMQLSDTFFASPAGPVLSAYAYNSTVPLSDKLSSEISSAIEALGDGYSLPLYTLHYGLLDQLKSPITAVLYQRMSTSPVIQQRILGLSGLVRSGSSAAFSTAAQLASTFEGHPMENGVLLISIRDHFRPADPIAVGQAAEDTHQNLAFREASAHALAAVHSQDALPYLAALLDASYPSLRTEAIGGLGAFANGLPIQTNESIPSLAHLQLPSKAPYQTAETIAHLAFGSRAVGINEAEYLSFWKTWWAQNRASMGR